ncbi:FK506-binding protein-like [Colossoma macropomum]|uniref:FK506-binding protein-like n=1 Tax=Colossoma macropomum TaxID=42526 RepID=UPI0018641C14|nr:FK506-binding protein-like [Colossoma macropomum]
MATETGKESEFTLEAPWISVSPAGLWEVQRRWTEERKKGDDTPLLGSVCKIRVSLKNHTEQNTQTQNPNEPEPAVGDDSDIPVTQHPRSQDSVLQVPLDRWVLLRMGEGQCDIVESCLEGMRAGESCEFTVRAYRGDSKLVSSDGTQSEKTEEEGQCFSLHLHSFTPGQESWQMTPAEKWAWVQSHKQRGSQRFGKGDIWGAAQSYCCAVKLIISLKGHTRGKEEDQKEVDKGEDPDKETDLTTQDDKGKEDGEKEVKATQSCLIPTEEEYRTMKTELHSNLSLCQLKLGQPAKARASSTKATALDPTSVKAWYRLGQACMQLGDFGEARQAFSKVLQLQPDSASARTALKQVNAKAKELDSKLGQRLSKMFS